MTFFVTKTYHQTLPWIRWYKPVMYRLTVAKANSVNRERITVSPQRITRLRLGDTGFSLLNRITRVRFCDTWFLLRSCIINFVNKVYHQMIQIWSRQTSLQIWITEKIVAPPVAFWILLVTHFMGDLIRYRNVSPTGVPDFGGKCNVFCQKKPKKALSGTEKAKCLVIRWWYIFRMGLS